MADLSRRRRSPTIPLDVIREATAADIPRLVDMGTRFLTETVYAGRVLVNPAAMTRTLELLLTSDDGGLFVSEQDGAVTGMIGLLAFEHPITGERAAQELFWWVEPESRGHGVRLLKRGEEWAATVGAQHLHMIAPTPAVGQLYERLGYGYLESAYQKAIA
jgi:GNAT superfamily N-acetyltransferase